MNEKTVHKASQIGQSLFSRNPVSIIIPFHGQYGLVKNAVKSILLATRSNPYEICLVDDGSPNEEFIKRCEGTPQVITVRSEKQLGFVGALQLGMEATKQPWVVFFHSDCEIKDSQWLIKMGRMLVEQKSRGIRMVSAQADNPGGGYSDYLMYKNAVGENHIMTEGDGPIPFYCSMCHRELFARTGGFLKNYFPAGYEDEEFSFRMRKFGFKQAVCGSTWVKHVGGATINSLCQLKPELKNKIEGNRDLCLKDIKTLL